MVTITHHGTHELTLEIGQYAVGNRLAVTALENDEHYATLSVNVPEEAMAEDEFAFKTYSENEGLFEACRASGAVEWTGRFTEGPMRLPICRLAALPKG